MRALVLIFALFISLVETGDLRRVKPRTPLTSTASTTESRIDFDRQLKPIFQSKCMPCHFSGGKMYERMPFDKPETIRRLGTRLFTRIQDEEQRKLIRAFLAQSP